jgi:hypothetical protein
VMKYARAWECSHVKLSVSDAINVAVFVWARQYVYTRTYMVIIDQVHEDIIRPIEHNHQ